MKTFQEFEQYLTGYGFVSCPLTEAQWRRCPGASAYSVACDVFAGVPFRVALRNTTEHKARKALLGRWVGGGRGRTDHPRRITWQTRVKLLSNSAEPPHVKGLPYWKTTLRNGAFNKVLYTPSTLRIEVGEHWL